MGKAHSEFGGTMKLINLKFRGITDESGFYDFGNKVEGLVNVEGGDEKALRTLLSFAFYGNEDAVNFKLPLITELRFVLAYEEYYLYRKLVRLESGETLEEAKLTNFKGEPVCEQTKEGVDAFLAEKISLTKEAFEELFLIDREEGANIAKDTISRETIVAESLGKFAKSNKVNEMLEELLGEEAFLVNRLEVLDPVSRGEIENYEALVDSNKTNLEEVRVIMANINDELQKATMYKEEMTQLYDETSRLEKLEAQKEEMAELSKKVANSKEARALANVFSAYGEILLKIDEDQKKLEDISKQLDVFNEKIEKGKASLIKQGDKYAALALTVSELEKVLYGLLDDARNHPENIDLEKMLEKYYAPINQRAKELMDEYNKVQAEALTLSSQNVEIMQKKINIRDTFEYKKAVQDGAVIEGQIGMHSESLAAARDRRELLTVERAQAIEALSTIERETQGENSEFKLLDKEIRGKYKTVEQAVNADVFYKQRIYSKHLLVSRNEVELNALIKKLEGVEEANKTYNEKLQVLKDRRLSIVKHRERLVAKLELLKEKLTEYMSENRLREISERVEFGSRCPICDGFVSVKKTLPIKDTKALNTQIDAVQRDISKDDKALLEAEAAIGQYEAAAHMGDQYAKSLTEAKKNKEEFVNEILAEYDVQTIEELFEKTKKTIADSNALQKKVDRYRELEKGFEKQAETKKILEGTVKLIDEEKLPAEDKIIAELTQKIADMIAVHDSISDYFGDETATDLLRKVQVIDKEYEALEHEYEEKYTKLSELDQKRVELFVEAMNYSTYNVPLNYKDKEYDSKQMVVKVFSEYLIAIQEEIDSNKKLMEKAKLKIKATKQVHEKNIAERDELRDQAIVLGSSLSATKQTSSTIYADYEQKFKEMGIETRSDLDRLIMGDLETEKAEAKIEKFEQEIAAAAEAVRLYQESTKNIAKYYENMNENNQALAELKDKEEEFIIVLGENMAKKKAITDRFEEISDLNKRLATVQTRIKGIKDLEPAIKDGAIIAKDFAELLFDRTNSIVRSISKGRYKVVKGSEGSFVLALAEKGKIRTDNLTREEKMLLPLATSAAYNESMLALLGGQIITAIKLTAAENDKATIKPLYDYSQSRDIIVLNEDDNSFSRVISRI